jgi:hypothetical protein
VAPWADWLRRFLSPELVPNWHSSWRGVGVRADVRVHPVEFPWLVLLANGSAAVPRPGHQRHETGRIKLDPSCRDASDQQACSIRGLVTPVRPECNRNWNLIESDVAQVGVDLGRASLRSFADATRTPPVRIGLRRPSGLLVRSTLACSGYRATPSACDFGLAF